MEASRKYPIAEHKFPYGSGDEYNFLMKTYHSTSTEVQRNILHSNFDLTDEDISSWNERALRYNMSPESFTFFLHITISSAMDDSDEIDDFLDKANEDDAAITYSSDDRDLITNWPIAIGSGSNKMDVDHSINTTTSSNTVIQSVPDKPQSQVKQIPEKSITDSTKSSNKKNKLNKHLIKKVITGHKPADDDTSKVRDILVYDVPVSWTAEYILQQLTLWGKPIDIQMKHQKKYQTVRLKIELSTFRLAQFEVNENPAWTTDLGGIPVRWFPTGQNSPFRQNFKLPNVGRNLV
ncbi:hypothetical protein RhiirA4_479553 [Rhizophagus irregularis]|uniref:Uncharacterized protein n=1 Tax=Rhizophagus irregularis TaxID=588596 RepID=A0A2I1HGJ4_9GLOM|nr:hypothetical protein RhiirA4_479553 [Rhizophagus irregularis]